MAAWYDQIAPKFVANVANKYASERGFEAFEIFPQVPVKQRSGYIAKYNKEDWLKIEDPDKYQRVGATESVGGDYGVARQPYTLLSWSFHKDVPKEDIENYDSPFDAVRDATEFVVTRLKRVALKVVANAYFADGVWSADKVGGVDFTKWSEDTSDPVADILQWQQTILEATGFLPNRMVITYDVLRVLKSNPAVLNRMKTTSDKVITRDLLAKLFEVNKLVVVDAPNENADGLLVSNQVLLLYAPDRPSVLKPSAGYFLLSGRYGLDMVKTRAIPMPQLNDALRIEGEIIGYPLKLASDLGIRAKTVA